MAPLNVPRALRRLYSSRVATRAPDYNALQANLAELKKKGIVGGSLTLAEKILYSHIWQAESKVERGASYLKIRPDRVAMQDASAQMALLQFMLAGRDTTAVPTSIHCDHLIQASVGAEGDLKSALNSNKEVFEFLESAALRYGIAFWRPGSVLENYAAPGLLMLGTDSHTPNAGGLGAIAIGVGGADAVDGMAGIPWELKAPKILGVHLKGRLSDWASPKDVILHLAGKLTVQGGTNHIIEYFGPGVDTITCTGMATICNMGAEVGCTTSVFPFTRSMSDYLKATNRADVAAGAEAAASGGFLSADKSANYDKVIEIDLSSIEPSINGPFSPDIATPLSKFKDFLKENGWSDSLSAGLIGSCTNSSYEDMTKAASIVKQATGKGLKFSVPFLVTPGSEQIRATIETDGLIDEFEKGGATVLANACGPCIGQWKRSGDDAKSDNSILTSFNRNFKARNDGNAKTRNFLASPEIVTAMSIAGRLSFDPTRETLTDSNGKEFKLSPPVGEALPTSGFKPGNLDFKPTNSPPNKSVAVQIAPSSDRLQVLEPFGPWDGQEISGLKLLVKVRGKCTTDHISAAGPWLKEDTIPNVARHYKANGVEWVVIGDQNYGEETNLKKQGVFPFTFQNPKDYELIPENATLSTSGLQTLAPGSKVDLIVSIPGKENLSIPLVHTLSYDQIQWIKAGGAINLIASQMAEKSA
ncbi:aconitate hydratase [Phlyctochytrium bullatum]|nr:aconitate hydratase [Phlyctochytrium bullatum]